MSEGFYDINFNQPGIAISGYLISDDAYSGLLPQFINISSLNVWSYAQATNNIPGAMSMARGIIPIDGGYGLGYEIYTPDPEHDPDTKGIKVTFYNTDNTELESIVLPYNNDYTNLSLVGYVDGSNILQWVSVGYQIFHTDGIFIDGSGFSSTVKNILASGIYLKYKYEYQVEIQKALRGSDGFEIMKPPANGNWDNVGVTPNVSVPFDVSKFLHCGTDAESISTKHHTNAVWANNMKPSGLALNMSQWLEENGGKMGSDIFRKLPGGQFYSGIDLDNDNVVFTHDVWANPYDISFDGGTLRLIHDASNKLLLQLLDDDDNVIDYYEFTWYSGASPNNNNPIGDYADARSTNMNNAYLMEMNQDYYLVTFSQYLRATKNGYSYQNSNYYLNAGYNIVYKFSTAGNSILRLATEEGIVPVNPDDVNTENTSNQTESDETNEIGNHIPTPDYSSGEWSDGTSDGIRGSGNPRPTGGNSQKELDQQPDMPDAPSIPTAVSTGFMKLYNPTDAEIQSLCAELVQDTFLDDLRKYFGNNPLDFIVGLQVVPGAFSIDNQKYTIKYGSYQSQVGMSPITDEFATLDYGTLDLKETYASWEDYNPHTKMSIYLPYIGIKDLDPDRIQGTELHLKYHIDAITGSIVAVLTSKPKDDKHRSGAELLVGQWAGQAAYTIPLTNVQHNAAVNAVIGVVSAAVSVGAAIATSGTSVAAQAATAAAVGTSIGNAALSGAHAGKTDITMQGSVSGSLAFFTGHDAYIQIEYPLEGRPDDYDHLIGKPSNITTDLNHQPAGSYIEFINVDVSGINAPQEEKAAIVEMLKGGVYK